MAYNEYLVLKFGLEFSRECVIELVELHQTELDGERTLLRVQLTQQTRAASRLLLQHSRTLRNTLHTEL